MTDLWPLLVFRETSTSSVRPSLLPWPPSMLYTEDTLLVRLPGTWHFSSVPWTNQGAGLMFHLLFQVRWSRRHTSPCPPTTICSQSLPPPHNCWPCLRDGDSPITLPSEWTLDIRAQPSFISPSPIVQQRQVCFTLVHHVGEHRQGTLFVFLPVSCVNSH